MLVQLTMEKSKEKYNIICISNQLWDLPNWTNKRHVMYRLAERGHTVLYVDPPINLGFMLIRQILKGSWNLQRLLSQTYKDKSSAKIFTPINLLPFSKITSYFHILNIQKIAKKNFDPMRKTVLWVYHVQLVELTDYLENLNYDVLVYDCVDNYEAFPPAGALFRTNVYGEKLHTQEELLAEKADVVFATAPGLVNKLRKFNNNVYFTPNVGDYNRFKDTMKYKDQLPEDLAKISRPRVGMIGAMDDYKFDKNLVRRAAIDNPEISFVLIGPIALRDKGTTIASLGLADLKNVFYLGVKPYPIKHLYMAGFDVEMIPYKLNDYTVGGCFPVKFHDALAAGLPVVVTDLPAYTPFEDVCYISKSEEDFSKNVKRAIQEDNADRRRARQLVAKENNWDGKVDKMLQLIESSIN